VPSVDGEENVFVSWSGELSRLVAEALRDWLGYVLHAARPFMSAQDVAVGDRWLSRLSRLLDSVQLGIIVVTRGNIGAPWIQFEAGALAKRIGESRVVPMAFGCELAELMRDHPGNPLVQFQGADLNRLGTSKLVRALNEVLSPRADDATLRRIFDKWWPELEVTLAGIAAREWLAQSPQDAVFRWNLAVHNGDSDLVAKLMSPATSPQWLGAHGGVPGLVARYRDSKAIRGMIALESVDMATDRTCAFVRYTVAYSDGKTRRWGEWAVFENGVWKARPDLACQGSGEACG